MKREKNETQKGIRDKKQGASTTLFCFASTESSYTAKGVKHYPLKETLGIWKKSRNKKDEKNRGKKIKLMNKKTLWTDKQSIKQG